MFPSFSETERIVMPDNAAALGLTQHEADLWRTMDTDISEWWDWFRGEKLKQYNRTKPGKDGQFPLLYPLQINPIRLACQLHAYALQGQVKDTSDPLVHSVCETKGSTSKDVAQQATDAIEKIAYENHARAMFSDMFLSIQAKGAMVLKVGWNKDAGPEATGVRWEYIDPRYAFFRWQGTDYWSLTEAWIRLNISKATAKMYGVTVEDNTVTYVEHWTPTQYSIKVADKYAFGKNKSDDNPYGFVPFVYIPHERSGDFWGVSLVPGAIGVTREINARAADMGDAVQKGVHRRLVGWNFMPGHPVDKDFGNGEKYTYLGKTVSGSDPQPNLQEIKPMEMPTSYNQFLATLSELVRTSMQTPDVAYGEPEASQRSGASMNHRMWPLLSHTITERTNWTTGINQLCDFSMRIMAAHQKDDITKAHIGKIWRQDWAPMVPLDRAALVTELIQRWENNVISLELLMEKFGDVPDLKEEVARVQKLQADAAKQEMQQGEQKKNLMRNAPTEKIEEGD